ncbi:MAG: putative 4-mercaptohistidine N1-methyltransferase [Verrucomicrobiales bacterium]|jgi:putative 4-mercaptohistidine N1-methyltranferase
MNPYETQKLVDEYLLFHYGSDEEVLTYPDGPVGALGFAIRSVTAMMDVGRPRGRALDLGCAVGRSSFELSKFCDSVVGIDFSNAFIETAEKIRSGASLGYQRLEEGSLKTPLVAEAPTCSRPELVSFEVGDAMDLRADIEGFDLVHAANLICRLPEPSRLLRRLGELVGSGGELILTTPCTWLGEFTPPENWPEGRTIDWLQRELDGDFELDEVKDLPFLIRETARKFQWTVAQGSRWIRR